MVRYTRVAFAMLTELSNFKSQMLDLQAKWTDNHPNGSMFYEWFARCKSVKFTKSVIAPVCQRAGLGCPPSKFTTNRSERINGVIQDFLKHKCGHLPVDVFTFAGNLKDLVDMQEVEVEMTVVDKGEYVIRPAYNHLKVTANQWVKMTAAQQEIAFTRIHSSRIEEVSPTNVAAINEALG